MSDHEYWKGYREQAIWLGDKSPQAARNALESRRGTLGPDPYNAGGNQATIDHIARLAASYCPVPAQCAAQACPEHPAHNGPDHTYEQHHDPADHAGPGPCLCTVYRDPGDVDCGLADETGQR